MKAKLNKIELFFPAGVLAFCLALFWAVVFPGASTAAPPLEEVVDRLQRIYEKTQDFQAGFIQETTVKSIRKTDTESGTVYFKNPGQMLWDYKKPKAKKLIINAQKAWLYLPQDKTVYVQDSGKIMKSEALIKFLSGLGKLNNDFTIQYASPAEDPDGNCLLLLYPREKGASYSFLRMTVAKNNFYILQVGFDDVMGNSTLLRFSNIKMNSGLPSKLFQFHPPPGVSIFKMP